ncbi:hypothetical protein FF38_09651 [Lucilia cuprina]|uniref:BPTI/Kunitz inhibitor domain-containing protein n=1 Tax=Lucilia cuprina TaxID=7375 RepID=A0A0L0BX95_LUCCU|nr:hypothetical protein CVS40_7137 [Lucilia cuprina]KNC24616.1 hypothetical protein FF38_09651 [Lucilia cuprina]
MILSRAKRVIIVCCILLNLIYTIQGAGNRTRAVVDICDRQPTINGLCGSSTLGIYYDAETQRCKYLGCSPDKKIFSSLEDCEKICNRKNRRRHRRVRYSKP